MNAVYVNVSTLVPALWISWFLVRFGLSHYTAYLAIRVILLHVIGLLLVKMGATMKTRWAIKFLLACTFVVVMYSLCQQERGILHRIGVLLVPGGCSLVLAHLASGIAIFAAKEDDHRKHCIAIIWIALLLLSAIAESAFSIWRLSFQ